MYTRQILELNESLIGKEKLFTYLITPKQRRPASTADPAAFTRIVSWLSFNMSHVFDTFRKSVVISLGQLPFLAFHHLGGKDIAVGQGVVHELGWTVSQGGWGGGCGDDLGEKRVSFDEAIRGLGDDSGSYLKHGQNDSDDGG